MQSGLVCLLCWLAQTNEWVCLTHLLGKDYFMDESVRTRGDGHEQILALDTTGDGKPDLWAIDTDGDGKADLFQSDTDGDGQVDVTMVDLNQDGTMDTIIDGDGGHPSP